MKTYLVIGALALCVFGIAEAASDYYLKIDGVKGESSAPSLAPTVQTEVKLRGDGSVDDTQPEARTAPGMQTQVKLRGDGSIDDSQPQQGKVEVEWKVEKGESLTNTGIEPDEIDFSDDGEPITPDFGVLLGGGSDEDAQEGRARAADVLRIELEASGVPTEEISLNYEKVTTKVRQEVKLFGFIPVAAVATVEVDAEAEVKVRFPWWSFLASGADRETVGQRIFTALSNVLKTKHDTVKNAINNIR